MWEVFQPSNGNPILRVPFRWIARLAARLFHDRYPSGLDYARIGEGWTGL